MAHHPDYSMSTPDLIIFEAYIKFYLDSVTTSENISYLYCIAAQLKTVKDRFLKDSKSLWVVSEMTMMLVREICAGNNWILQTWPGKIGIPREIFERLSVTESSTLMKTVYLEQTDYLKGMI